MNTDEKHWYCPKCDTDWKRILDDLAEAVHRRDINYCLECGTKLNNPLEDSDGPETGPTIRFPPEELPDSDGTRIEYGSKRFF